MQAKSPILSAYVALCCLFLMAPVGIVVILAFSNESYLVFPPRDYSLRWFRAFLGDEQWRQSLTFSLSVAILSSILSTVVSFFAAYGYVREHFRYKKAFLAIMLMPIIAPTVITAIAMYFLTVRIGLVGNVAWLALCHSVISIPIVLIILIAAIKSVDLNIERAAFGLGAGRFYVFRHVTIPMIYPSVISALLFSFLASFDELIVSLFLSGARRQTMPVKIWNSLHLEVEPVIAAVSAFLIGVTCMILFFNFLFMRRRRPASRHG